MLENGTVSGKYALSIDFAAIASDDSGSMDLAIIIALGGK